MMDLESQSYYEVLDVKPDASQNEIRQAYFRAKAAYGKDSAALYSIFDDQETKHVLEIIEQAYVVLSSPEKRKEYDKVHGFLKSADGLPQTKKTPAQSHVYSFNSGRAGTESADPAQQAAQAVFGTSTGADVNSSFTSPSAALPSTRSTVEELPPHEDYSTPRTLASSSASGPPVQEYIASSNTESFSAKENRLGVIRRSDLVKPYDKNPVFEDEIARETQFRGEFLKRVREYKSISVDEISEFTKISRTYLNCIESEEFESLPAPAYLRGFVVQIAKALKLPHEKVAAAYMQHYKETVLK